MKLWSGRFTKNTKKELDDFHSSISFDMRLYRQDIMGSIAHSKALLKCGVITEEEFSRIKEGLEGILRILRTASSSLMPVTRIST